MRTFDAPINADDGSFERAVLRASLPVVAVFWSAEETPREALDSVLQKAARAYAGEVLIVKLDVKDAPKSRSRYDAAKLPEFLFFRDGNLVARAKGMPSLKALRPWIEYLLQRGPKPAAGRPSEVRTAEAVGHPVTVSDSDFERVVLQATVPVLVDFWAAWCGPCHAVAPVVEELARAYAGRVLVAKLDIDANPATAQRLGVMSIPTLVFFRGGQEVDRIVGAQPQQAVAERLEALL